LQVATPLHAFLRMTSGIFLELNSRQCLAKRPTTVNFRASWERMRAGRVRILWLVLGALLLVSALPIGLYHRQVLQLSQDKLIDNERVQQTDLTRSLTQEIQFFAANMTQQLVNEVQILALMNVIDNVEDPVAEPKGHACIGELRGQQ